MSSSLLGSSVSLSDIVPGAVIRFGYPAHNFLFLRSELEARVVRVVSVRDTLNEPLAPVTVELNPFRRRSRYLVTAFDLDRQEERSFYWESMQHPQTAAVPLAAQEWSILVVDADGSPPERVAEARNLSAAAEILEGLGCFGSVFAAITPKAA